MSFKFFLLIVTSLLLGTGTFAQKQQKTPKLKFTSWVSLKIPEPSDVSLSPDGKSLYMVSDNAIVFETDLEGKVMRKATPVKGIDFEAIWAAKDALYVADETTRKIHKIDYTDLSLLQTYNFSYAGGRNKGIESLTFNKEKQRFVLITESSPVLIFETDSNFVQLNELEWDHSRDISGATYHQGHIWLLSDEDMTVFKCNPLTYDVIAKWEINVHNPEGIAFDKQNRMIIVADDLERLYFFSQPE